MNSTCYCEQLDHPHYYEVLNLFLVVILLPILALTGLITNVINITIFRKIRLQNSGYVYLGALACSDAMVNLTCVGVYIDSIKGFVPGFFDSRVMAFVIRIVPLSYIAQTCSIYLTLSAVVNGYVQQKSLVRYLPRPKIIVASILAFSLGYNAVRFFELRTRSCYSSFLGMEITEICPTQVFLQNSVIYHAFMYTILMNILPYAGVLSFTCLIIKRYHKEVRQHVMASSFSGQTAFAVPSTAAAVLPTRRSERPLVLILVALVFIGCNVLPLISTIMLTAMTQNMKAPMLSMITIHILGDIGNVLVIVNAMANFFIYLGANPDFRLRFFKMFTSRRAQGDSQNEPLLSSALPSPNLNRYATMAVESQTLETNSCNVMVKYEKNFASNYSVFLTSTHAAGNESDVERPLLHETCVISSTRSTSPRRSLDFLSNSPVPGFRFKQTLSERPSCPTLRR